jgi:hypothetical protein
MLRNSVRFVSRLLTNELEAAGIFGCQIMAVVFHPPYSSDLAPRDFSFFPSTKMQLRRLRLQDVPEIQERSLTYPHAIPRNQFQRCLQQWQRAQHLTFGRVA